MFNKIEITTMSKTKTQIAKTESKKIDSKTLTSKFFNLEKLSENLIPDFSKINLIEIDSCKFPLQIKLNESYNVPSNVLRNTKSKTLNAKNFDAEIEYFNVNTFNPEKNFFVKIIVKNFNIEHVMPKKLIYKIAFNIKIQLNAHVKQNKLNAEKLQTEKTKTESKS